MTTDYTAKHIETLVRESAALIDAAFDLEQQQAVVDGTIVSTYLPPSRAKRLIVVTLQEIEGGLSVRDRALQTWETEARERAEQDAAKAKHLADLEAVAAMLPADWNAKVTERQYSGAFIDTSVGVAIKLHKRYASGWRARPIGDKLVVSCNFQERSFPRKKDGTFSLDKVQAYADDMRAAAARRESAEKNSRSVQEQFQAIAQPFVKYVVYGKVHSWTPSQNFSIRAEALGDGKYAVRRTVTEYVDGAQLAAILEQEVGRVERDKEVQA